MANLLKLARSLTSGCSVSGFEDGGLSALEEIRDAYFDELTREPAGSYILKRNARKPGLPKIMLDAHMDEVGMMVTEVLEGGFLRFTNIGGLDTRILQAADVTIYGKETLYGVIVSTPPHLQTGDRSVLPPVTDLMIDTGLTKEKAEELIPVGTPVGYMYKLTELKNNRICGKGFDDKICAVALIEAVEQLINGGYEGELDLVLSTKEEISRAVVTAAYRLQPDYAIVSDVCCAWVPGSDSRRKTGLGDGPEISLSAITDVRLTKKLIKFAKDNEYKHTVTVEATSTGTNANDIPLVGLGIPTVLVSIPLRNMHTYSEVVSLDDVADAAKLIAGFIKEIGKEATL
ncbi:MAG: M20/M25/M40 family metallo-hydrolase [Clostridia bacterium]|nr:M20/M25/M40 family metallo-hydrolase [Clostridia bacterium]MBQ3870419.1 M20/M25/M40 family metallo-hydrolase [Clostridia bacterium]